MLDCLISFLFLEIITLLRFKKKHVCLPGLANVFPLGFLSTINQPQAPCLRCNLFGHKKFRFQSLVSMKSLRARTSSSFGVALTQQHQVLTGHLRKLHLHFQVICLSWSRVSKRKRVKKRIASVSEKMDQNAKAARKAATQKKQS